MDTTDNQPDKMSTATEAVKRALIGVTQDGGCKPETIALVNEAVRTWDTVESEVCSELRNQLGTANETIRILHANLQDRSKEMAEQQKKHAAFINEATEDMDRKTSNVRHWRENCGKLEAQVKVLKEEAQQLKDKCGQQADLIEKFDEAMKVIELNDKREIRFGYDPHREEFYVVFRSGQRITFDRAKSITGNVENWLATLRHQVIG